MGSIATARIFHLRGHRQRGVYIRRHRFKAVNTQGVPLQRRCVATAGGFLCKGGAGVSPASSEASQS